MKKQITILGITLVLSTALSAQESTVEFYDNTGTNVKASTGYKEDNGGRYHITTDGIERIKVIKDSVDVSGSVKANKYYGDGSGLTGIKVEGPTSTDVANTLKADAAFITSVKGDKGDQGNPGQNGTPGPTTSAVTTALKADAAFITSVKGAKGDQGNPGVNGTPGPTTSAVTTALKADAAFITSVKGEKGDQGPSGTNGITTVYKPSTLPVCNSSNIGEMITYNAAGDIYTTHYKLTCLQQGIPNPGNGYYWVPMAAFNDAGRIPSP